MSRLLALRLYRNLLQAAKRLPDTSKKTRAVADIRSAFRRNQNETKTDTVMDALKRGESTLKYLQMVTPHRVSTQDTGTFTVKDGQVVSDKIARQSVRPYLDKRVTAEDVKRHYALWEKQVRIGM